MCWWHAQSAFTLQLQQRNPTDAQKDDDHHRREEVDGIKSTTTRSIKQKEIIIQLSLFLFVWVCAFCVVSVVFCVLCFWTPWG